MEKRPDSAEYPRNVLLGRNSGRRPSGLRAWSGGVILLGFDFRSVYGNPVVGVVGNGGRTGSVVGKRRVFGKSR